MNQDDLATLVPVVVCGYLAYGLLRWLWPIFAQRERLTPQQLLERANEGPWAAQQRERLRELIKYGTPIRTLTVHLVNQLLLLAWIYIGAASQLVFWGVFVYLGIGLLVLRRVGAPDVAGLAGLNAIDRLWLRVFYAWQWPLYVPYLVSGK
jgi:hypothetical protein